MSKQHGPIKIHSGPLFANEVFMRNADENLVDGLTFNSTTAAAAALATASGATIPSFTGTAVASYGLGGARFQNHALRVNRYGGWTTINGTVDCQNGSITSTGYNRMVIGTLPTASVDSASPMAKLLVPAGDHAVGQVVANGHGFYSTGPAARGYSCEVVLYKNSSTTYALAVDVPNGIKKLGVSRPDSVAINITYRTRHLGERDAGL